jgi:hypothetical protein
VPRRRPLVPFAAGTRALTPQKKKPHPPKNPNQSLAKSASTTLWSSAREKARRSSSSTTAASAAPCAATSLGS